MLSSTKYRGAQIAAFAEQPKLGPENLRTSASESTPQPSRFATRTFMSMGLFGIQWISNEVVRIHRRETTLGRGRFSKVSREYDQRNRHRRPNFLHFSLSQFSL